MEDERQVEEPTPEVGSEDASKKALEEANKKTEEYLRLAQRLQADFTNYKRRAEEERKELSDIACGNFSVRLLPVLDDLDKAMQALPEDLAKNDWVAGVKLIKQKFDTILQTEGLEEIKAEGARFDPWEHDAILMEEAEKLKPGTVKQVFRKGYKYKGRVVRPAQVSVVKEKSGKDSEKPEGKEKQNG